MLPSHCACKRDGVREAENSAQALFFVHTPPASRSFYTFSFGKRIKLCLRKRRHIFNSWWRRRESNPRPKFIQALKSITYVFRVSRNMGEIGLLWVGNDNLMTAFFLALKQFLHKSKNPAGLAPWRGWGFAQKPTVFAYPAYFIIQRRQASISYTM